MQCVKQGIETLWKATPLVFYTWLMVVLFQLAPQSIAAGFAAVLVVVIALSLVDISLQSRSCEFANDVTASSGIAYQTADDALSIAQVRGPIGARIYPLNMIRQDPVTFGVSLWSDDHPERMIRVDESGLTMTNLPVEKP